MVIFSSSIWRRKIAASLIVLLLLPMISRAEPPVIQDKSESVSTELDNEEEAQPKFIWGILIKFAASKIGEMFSEWAYKQLFKGVNPPLTLPSWAAVSPPEAGTLAPTAKGAEPIVPNITDSPPTAPLVVENGKENYQGVLLSLLVLQPDGLTYKVRPISKGFKSGEKFRIRVGATFAGELSFDNIDPQGKRSRLYPAHAEQIVKIKSGTPVILPLDKNSFFQFDNVSGEEKLIVTLRDPRALCDTIQKSPVHQHENELGTGLLQEVAEGKFAVIAESIMLQHQ